MKKHILSVLHLIPYILPAVIMSSVAYSIFQFIPAMDDAITGTDIPSTVITAFHIIVISIFVLALLLSISALAQYYLCAKHHRILEIAIAAALSVATSYAFIHTVGGRVFFRFGFKPLLNMTIVCSLEVIIALLVGILIIYRLTRLAFASKPIKNADRSSSANTITEP